MPDVERLRDHPLWDWLAAHPVWIGAAVAIIAFVESFAVVGVAVPGVALLAAAAFLAGSGDLDLWLTLACAFGGAVAGDGVSYLLGRRFGPAVRELGPLARHPHWIERGERFFQRHGLIGIVLGRFVGPIRPIMPLMAGTLGMPPVQFFAVNVASALAWAPAYILPGFLLGASLMLEVSLPPAFVFGLILAGAWCWGLGHLTVWAWRTGARGGRLYERLARRLPSRAGLLQSLAPSGGIDTRLSLLAGASTFSALAAATLALAWWLPVLAPWRRFAVRLGEVLIELL